MKIVIELDNNRIVESVLEQEDFSCDGCYFQENREIFGMTCDMGLVCRKYDFIFKEM